MADKAILRFFLYKNYVNNLYIFHVKYFFTVYN